jgi:hypothetical protein
VVGQALRLLDVDLAHPWTVEVLAAMTGPARPWSGASLPWWASLL